MARMDFADDAGGTGLYTLTYNPVSVTAPQSKPDEIKKTVVPIDGEGITFTPALDTRRGKLTWKVFRADNTSFITMLSELATYVGGYKYMKWNEVGTALSIYTTYTKVKIISLNKTVRDGGAIIYDSVELVWENAEA